MRIVIILLLGLTVGVGAAVAYAHRDSILASAAPSCTVSVNGTSVNLTVRGTDADSVCGALTRSPVTSRAGTVDSGSGICDYGWHGDTFTLHANGALMIGGSAACVTLQNASTIAAVLTVLLKVAVLLSG